jgi:hypothetical protein
MAVTLRRMLAPGAWSELVAGLGSSVALLCGDY